MARARRVSTAVMEGHAERLPELVPRLRAVVGRVARTREVDDLVQECCVRVLEREHLYRGGRSGFGAWAAAVARNVARNVLRRPRLPQDGADVGELASAEPGPEDAQERIGWVLDQLARLPAGERELLRLRYYDGLTVEAVGARLGIGQAAASKRLELALARLRRRARRQGLFGVVLPVAWAAALAGGKTMQWTFAGAASALAVAAGAAFFFLPDPDTPVQGTTDLAHTTFAPSLAAPLDPRRNTLWCGSLQLAWRAFAAAAGPRLDAGALDGALRLVHDDPFRAEHVDPESYVAVGGLDAAALVDEAQDELEERFGRGPDPVLERLRASDGMLVGYAFLAKELPFEHAFEDLATYAFRFGSGEAAADVEAWGLSPYDPHSAQDRRRVAQARIVHWAGPDELALELAPRGARDRIVLARLEPRATLLATWERVRAWRAAYATLGAAELERLAWDGGERLWVPKLDFDLAHAFDGLAATLDGIALPVAIAQTLRVRLDHRGAEVRSRAVVALEAKRPDPKELVFDGPFLVAFVEADAELPYAALWVADAELLVPRRAQGERR